MKLTVSTLTPLFTLSMVCVGAGAFAAAGPQVPIFPSETIVLPSPGSFDKLGETFRLSDSWLAAGVESYDQSGTNDGAVFLWPRSGATTFGAPVVVGSPAPSFTGHFGRAVALGPLDSLFVSEARSSVVGPTVRETVHWYERQGASWTRTLSVNEGSIGLNGFGSSLDVSGDVLVVGAPLTSGTVPGAGAVYVYRLANGSIQLEQTLTPFDINQGQGFGDAVAIDGNTIVVGSKGWVDASGLVGAAYVYEYQAGAWVMVQRVAVDPATSDRWLGVSVDVDGDTVALGAARGNDRGAVYVLRRMGGMWSLEERISPANLGNAATFGHAVGLSGDQLVVGAYQDSVIGQFTGSAWTFQRSGASWSPVVRAVEEGLTAFHGFNVAVDAAGTVVVGRPNGAVSGAPAVSGALSVYPRAEPIGLTYCDAEVNSTGRVGQTYALGSDLVSEDRITLVASQLPNQAFGYFLCSRAMGFVPLAGGSRGNLCLDGEIGRYVGSGEIQNSLRLGYFELELTLGSMPSPTGFLSAVPGETWYFQGWHRDSQQGALTSNFTEALSVLLR